MQIKNHILEGVKFLPSPNVSGIINPQFVVMHYTAGFTTQSAIAALTNTNTSNPVSAHLVIGREGDITQLVPFNRKAWHAGPSQWMGFNGMNSHAIGIEIVNPGYFKVVNGQMCDWSGKPLSQSQIAEFDATNAVQASNVRAGPGIFYWPHYTPLQIEAVKQVFLAIKDTYPLLDVVGHEDIDTRKWKTDPGPAFPMKIFKDLLHTGSLHADIGDVPMPTKTVNTPVLNVRQQSSIVSDQITQLKQGQKVVVISQSVDWAKIQLDDGTIGFVASKFLT